MWEFFLRSTRALAFLKIFAMYDRKLEKSWSRYLVSNVWQELQEKYASQVRDVIH